MTSDNNKNDLISRKRSLWWVIAIPVLMFGFGFALVPIYNVLCSSFGINGKTSGPAAAGDASQIDMSRLVTVQFVATDNANLPWKFYPLQKSVQVHPGENKKVAFFAENDSGKTMTVQAIPSVSPGIAAKYLKKTECFCFTQQTFTSGQAMEMPLLFHLDPALPKDITTLTLSYTMFDTAGVTHPLKRPEKHPS